MRQLSAILILGVCMISSAAHSRQLTNGELEKTCAQRTIVTGYDENKKISQIGESIDGFCAGFIRASFEAFSTSQKCDAAGENPDFLLSVYSLYLKKHKPSDASSAYETLRIAFSRIPDCGSSTIK